MIEELCIDVTAKELSHHLECCIPSKPQTFELGAAASDGVTGQGSRS